MSRHEKSGHHNPIISIIIPCYNAEQWIGETLISVLSQTCHTLEIIVVDDGSTDEGTKIAQSILSLSDASYQIVRLTNGGPSRARNIGWKAAQGEWIQFLDADDLIVPEKIAYQLKIATQLDDEFAVVYSEWRRFTTILPNLSIHPSEVITPKINDSPTDLLRADSFIATGSQLFRRSWLDRVGGFDETMWLVEDVNLLLRIALAGGKFHIAEAGRPLFLYRQHATSLSKNHPMEFARACLKNTMIVDSWISTHGNITPYQRSVLIEAYSFIARNTFGNDSSTFEIAFATLNRLSEPKPYIPSNPLHLKVASRIVGYRSAERLASIYRQTKRLGQRPVKRDQNI